MADKGGNSSERIPHYRLVLSQTLLTNDVVQHAYSGSGTATDPCIVDWIPDDARNPMNMAKSMKWTITVIMALGTLSVTFSSTAFSGALPQIQEDLHTSLELSVLSVSLFVLGFAIAPMTWAPMSEHFGRQHLYAITFGLLTIFGAASIGSKSIQTLLVLRFLAGTFGSSSIVNSAGVIADMFVAKERGLAMMVYSSAPFVGPTIGPITGGFVAQYGGWRWNDGMTVIFTGVLWILGMIFVPETYTPYLLVQRAKKLEQNTGKKYVSKLESGKEEVKARVTLSKAIARPWIILFFEAIVLLLSIYSAIVYGIIYLIFTAFPIVFEKGRHWSQGVSGLSYVGVLVGQLLSMFFYVFLEVNYQKKIATNPGKAKPEGRLQPAMIGAVLLPIGLFWFAWSTYPQVHWIVSILGGAIFGFGQVLLYISLINYVVDAYTVYAASALAANAILRGLFAVAFPLFTPYMYQNLGNQWASSIPAFLALACTPLPFVFHMYGDAIRARSKYAAKAQKITAAMLNETKFGEKSPNAPSVAEEAAVETFGNGVGPEAMQKTSSVTQKVENGNWRETEDTVTDVMS